MNLNGLLICPNCGNKIIMDDSHCSCLTCSKQWEEINGVLVFAENQYYWNQISREDAKEICSFAKEEGWEKAIDTKLADRSNYLRAYIKDYSRADWHYLSGLEKDANVLDLGAGWGAVTIALGKYYKNVVAVDTTLETLEFTKIRASNENLQNISFLGVDPLDWPKKLPLAENSFDLIVLNGVLEWVGSAKTDEDVKTIQVGLLKHLYTLLMPSGQLYIGIENRFGLANFLGTRPHGELPFVGLLPRILANAVTKIFQHRPHRTFIYSPNGYKKLLTECGFNDIRMYWTYPSYRFPEHVIPINSKKEINNHVRDYISSDSYLKYLVKKLVYRLLPTSIIANELGMFARRESISK